MTPEEKTEIIHKFLTAFNESGLKKKDASKRIGFDPAVMSYLQNEKFRKRIYPRAFVLISDFLLSGKKLSEYQVVKPDIPTEQEIKKKTSDYQEGISLAAAVINKPEKNPEKSPNQFTHERLASRLVEAMETASMNNVEASRRLGITPEEICKIRTERLRVECLPKTWEFVKKFIISGKPLNEYHYLAPAVEVKTRETAVSSAEGHKFILDIEINLTLNGRRIEV